MVAIAAYLETSSSSSELFTRCKKVSKLSADDRVYLTVREQVCSGNHYTKGICQGSPDEHNHPSKLGYFLQ